jgi:hypothetical protein
VHWKGGQARLEPGQEDPQVEGKGSMAVNLHV